MAEIAWTARALAKIDAIKEHIEPFDPAAAERIAARLLKAGESLAYFPNRGRPGPKGTRELSVVPPYIIRYRVRGDVVTIVTVKHGRQRK